MKKMLIIFTLVILIILNPIVFAQDSEIDNNTTQTIYVSKEVSNESVDSISKAINIINSNNDTYHKIIIKEGNYTEYDLEITNQLEIVAEGDVVINGESKSRILTINTEKEVKIQGITFINSWDNAIRIDNAKVTINNCIFVNNTSDYGGAIYWNSDDGILSNSYFTLNKARIGSAVLWGTNDENDIKKQGKRGLIINTTFENNDNRNSIAGGCMGLAIYSDDVNVINSSFINNIGRFDTTGGSLYIYGRNTLVENCLFENNTMSQAPGVEIIGDNASIINCRFINNSIINQGQAGAVDVSSNNVKIINNTFILNGGEECHNGGSISIYTFEDGVKNITQNHFINNSAVYGGCIFINGGSQSYVYGEEIIIENNIFDGNEAHTAAGIYVMNVTIDESVVKITNNLFKNLKSTYSSAIYISSAEIRIKNNTIIDCISFDGNNHIYNNDGYIGGELSLKVSEEDLYGLYTGKSIDINATIIDDVGNNISGGIVYFIVNEENVDEDGFSLETGKATVKFYSTQKGLYLISADYYNGEIVFVKNTTIIAVPYIINIDFNQTKGVCSETITVPVDVSVIILEEEYIADGEEITITFNNEQFSEKLINGSTNITLTLPKENGTYILNITYDIKSELKKIVVKDNIVNININEIKLLPHDTILNVTLKDEFDDEVTVENITLKINNTPYDVKANSNVKLDLDAGVYNISIEYESDKYKLSSKSTIINIDYLKSILQAFDITMKYNDKINYIVRITDGNYNPLALKNISINLNGEIKEYTSDENGVVTVPLNLAPNNYTAIVTYNGDEIYNKSSVVNKIQVISNGKLEANNINMYFSDNTYYKVRLYDDSGKVASNGISISITINGKTSQIKTDKYGYASFKIKLNPDTYIITAKYNNLEKTSKIVVKNILKTKNITKKKSKTIKFQAKLVKGKKTLSGKKIKFKIGKKTYTKKTNKSGTAILTLKNLKAGKYKIYTMYSSLKNKNTIHIRK